MKKMIVGLMVVALLATAGLAMAQGWGRGPGCGPGAGGGPGYGPKGAGGAGLNLTAEQQQKMQVLREKHWNDTAVLREEMLNKKAELRNLWAQAAPDKETILAKQREINGLRDRLQEKGTQNRLEMRPLLSPEQQAQLNSYGPGSGPGYGMKGGFGPGRGMGMAGCPRW